MGRFLCPCLVNDLKITQLMTTNINNIFILKELIIKPRNNKQRKELYNTHKIKCCPRIEISSLPGDIPMSLKPDLFIRLFSQYLNLVHSRLSKAFGLCC